MKTWFVLALMGLVGVQELGTPLRQPGRALVTDVLEPGGLLLVGELHGTREIPLAFMGLVDVQLRRSKKERVTVALELPVAEQARVDAYLASQGTVEDRARLLAGPFWSTAQQDGRGSAAMAQLLELLRIRRGYQQDIQVVLFDAHDPKADSKSRDRDLAQALVTARKASPGRTFLVLTGNLHARKTVGMPWDEKLEPMGYLLTKTEPGLLTFDAAYASGETYACVMTAPGAPQKCGVTPMKGRDTGKTVGGLEKASSEDGAFDGKLHVGVIHASNPAVSTWRSTRVVGPQILREGPAGEH